MRRIHKLLFCFVILTFACSDNREEGKDSSTDLTINSEIDTGYHHGNSVPDLDPCENVTINMGGEWCQCHPLCCQSQLWFCPPIWDDPGYYKKEVIVDICNDNNEPCMYGHDEGCPPPEIIIDGECSESFECPPNSQGLDYGWQWCEMPDGSVGKQHVTCDKGQLYYSPCQPCNPEICDGIDNDCDGLADEGLEVIPCETVCGPGNAVCVQGVLECFGPEPQEEICDYLDNDCDGDVDEFQRNECDECGPVPYEECNGFDDDCDDLIDEELIQTCLSDCGTGVEICSSGQWIGCTAIQPSIEICDGLDNNCNGQIDEELNCLCTIQDVGVLFPCTESPLICGLGYKTCECIDPACLEIVTTNCYASCYWLVDPPGSDPNCDSLVGMPLNKEECNNFDDNCNQLIDEDLFSPCYTGPEGTLFVGICDEGEMTCNLGTWGGYAPVDNFIPGLCVDEVLPEDEICDGLDNNCDGIVDWGTEIADTDILFIVDWSGSMSDEIAAVLIALNQFAGSYADQDMLRWGLIVGPRQLGGWMSNEELNLISDISTFTDFLADFSALGDDGMDTGNEMLLDALYLSLQNISGNAPIDLSTSSWEDGIGSIPSINQFNLSWRPGADRVVIVFTDETEQSYHIPKITVEQVMDTCQAAPQTKVYTFSTQENWNWDELAANCNGIYYELTNNSLEMYNSLMEILDEICMPEE